MKKKNHQIKKNLRQNNTTPLMKHIRQREKEQRKKNEKNKRLESDKNKTRKNYSRSYNRDNNEQTKKKKKSENVLSRSESFSIFDVKYNQENNHATLIYFEKYFYIKF